MAFLDDYSGTERIDVGKGYWVDIKLCLSREEKRDANKYMSRMAAVQDDKTDKMVTRAVPDIERYRDEVVLASIVDWNLDDKDGVWQLSPPSAKRKNVNRLPEAVFDKVYKRANELNKSPEVDEQKTFRDDAEQRDHDADAVDEGAGDPGEVPDGAGILDQAWLEPGRVGETSLA